MAKTVKSTLLALNFHNTFKPERNYIHALLAYVAEGKKGTLQEISEQTGIPMGESSGKTQPTIHYCLGMGLMTISPIKQSPGVKAFELTAFGKKVFCEDPYLMYPITQWIAHFFMCHPKTGAGAWAHCFAEGYPASLGRTFTNPELTAFLKMFYPTSKKVVGPLLGMYTDNASFLTCGALKEDGANIVRATPPLNDEMYLGYGAWVIHLLEEFFPKQDQVPLSDFQDATKWLNITTWKPNELSVVLSELEKAGWIAIDRHMEPWLIIKHTDAKSAWQHIYDNIL